ncbi:dTDP-glucose 4,6-dehydratase [Nonomuraea longicatena]|uniref:dTDP-glucose 4,6-dehydratase n=1 Tax=Nonomuraea longicatena TaxID=83682 RepID=A0ABP4A507_9ACTN
MRLFVTGAAGFIGSHFARTVLADGYPGLSGATITALDKLTYSGNRDNLPADGPRLSFVHGDVCDRDLLRQVLPGHDAVVHFAAETHVDRSIEGADEFFRTNVLGTHTVLDTALQCGVGRVVHVSTDEVYGSIAKGSWTELDPLLPNSPYAASKAGSDLVARSYWRTHRLDVSITRCTNNYGPYQHPEKLIPLFITNLLEGGHVPVYGDGGNMREWMHVDDHCRAVALVLTRGRAGEVYNVGGGTEETNLAVTERLLELCGADRSAIRMVPDRKGHDLRYSVDESKIREELGYEPRIPFAAGLADTVAWYRDHPDWWKPTKHATSPDETVQDRGLSG